MQLQKFKFVIQKYCITPINLIIVKNKISTMKKNFFEILFLKLKKDTWRTFLLLKIFTQIKKIIISVIKLQVVV